MSAHFIGSVVYIEQGLYQVSGISPLLVIDGQQRLTTAMLLIEAYRVILAKTKFLMAFQQ
ncbi:GmrSD restriction endonuclease domain-containing protein [Escherichia coli]|uniref:GmrSD restriction endonuclease domain-containing protein n=1 Tax=Escherichia coli TaxID=562 RepID=UPI003EB90B7B